MADIGEFAQMAADRVLEYQKTAEDRFKLGLGKQAIEEFIKMAFYASLIQDEGRFPSVCLMSYRKGAESSFHFLFAREPIRPSTEEIAKMAHAVSPRSHICCICDKGQILLGGIHVTMLNEMREFGYGSGRVANPFKLVIRGPGHIEVSPGGIAMVYKGGNITEENPLESSRNMQMLVRAVEKELQELTSGVVENLNDVFNDLAKAIVRLGHGGMILVVKEPKASHFSSLKRIDCLLLQQLLIRYWNNVRLLTDSGGGPGKLLADAEAGIYNPHSLTVAKDTLMLENCIETIANLAGVDGAIVMTYDVKVAAFNAIIERSLTGSPSRVISWDGTPLQREDLLKNRGSRHQSALSYISAVPDSFAFVISQDGGISAFHNQGNGCVLCERGRRALD
jgi:hypothetical protein